MPETPTAAAEPAEPHKAEAQSRWLTCLVDHNPFYLLSGVCLLLGCFLVSSSLGEQREHTIWPLLSLLATVSVYEVVVLGLGIYLARWHRLRRDAIYLLTIGLVLLVDGGLLYNELMTLELMAGVVVSSVAFMLALVKIAVLSRLLGVALSPTGWGVVALSLVVMFALPGVARELFRAEMLGAWWLYGGWWLAGGLLALHAMEPMRRDALYRSDIADSTVQRVLRALLLVLPWLSVLGHLVAVHFVFEQAMVMPYLGPVLLGAGVYAMGQMQRAGALRVRLVTMFGVLALLLSVPGFEELSVMVAWPTPWALTPLRVALLVTGGLWLVTGIGLGAWRLLGLAGVSFALGAIGPTPVVIRERLTGWSERLMEWSRDLLPQTQLQWGVAVLVLAFGLLGAGAVVSFVGARRRRSLKDEGE